MTKHLSRIVAAASVLLGMAPAAMYAQGTTVGGRVVNEAQAPIQGVSVSITALGAGAYTDADGRYSFTVPAARATGQTVTLTARRIGFLERTVSIRLAGETVTHDFTLAPIPTQLSGVVVTALGQEREKSRLGTAQQAISGEELNTTYAPNIENQLQGKVSGVSIVGNGTQGGSVNINIRGYTSISQTNQPLFIVDGIPVSNAGRGSDSRGGSELLSDGTTLISSKDYGSAIQDINPEDIATLTVLKGPNAAAIYGSRAANGAIVITTKRGANRASNMDVSTQVTWDRPERLPDFQNQYGQGSGGQYQWINGAGALDGNDQSYGPKLDGRTNGCVFVGGTETYDQSKPCNQFTGAGPWIAHPDNVSSFFNTGRTMEATVAVSGGTDRASARLSVNGQNVDGIIPNEYLRRLGGTATGSLQVSDRLQLNGSVNYMRNGAVNRPNQGYGGGIMEGLFVWFGRQVDMNALEDNYDKSATLNGGPANREYNWNYLFHNNPYFMQYDNPESDQRDRVIASGSATYKLTDWLNVLLRSGTDTYRFNINNNYAAGNIELTVPAGYATPVNPAYNGAFGLAADNYTENNSDLILTASHPFTSHLQLNGTLGGTRRYVSSGTNTVLVNGITVPNIYNVANAALPPVNGQSATNTAVNSVYGSGSFTYNNWWTVEVTGRNDWSSTLPSGNNSYFYPSVNTSVVLTDAIPSIRNSVLTYLKLRGGSARVGNSAPAYSLYTTYLGNPSKYNGQPLFTLDNSLLNPNLKPETTVSNEGGVEVGLWDNRISLDASIYDKYTTDEISKVDIPTTTGYATKLVNAGKIDNKGFEALLSIDPVRGQKWSWNTTFNYSHNVGRVVSLLPGVNRIYFGDFQNVVEVDALAGEPLGMIRGFVIKRNEAGVPLLDAEGRYQASDDLVSLGSFQPKWTGGWVNTVRYGHAALSTTLDVRRGGKLFSGTNYYGTATGVLENTLYGREVDWNNPGIVINGIIEETGERNTHTITSEEYFQSISYSNAVDPYVYDDNWVKLREVRLSYDLPPSMAHRMSANAVNVALIGRNLWMSTSVPNVDPEISYNLTNQQGLEYAGLPAPRSFGFAVRVTP